jgi:hypothetical protein
VVLPVVGGPEQGMPVNGFVPVDGFNAPAFSAGETGFSRPLATVFPLITGLTVFPLSIGLLVFCASEIEMLATRIRMLRQISTMRFVAIDAISGRSPQSWGCNTNDLSDRA